MTKMQEYMQKGEDYILKTYNRYPVVFEKGDGVSLYDMDGKRYLDFAAGIAVFALGYNNKEYNDALKNQIDKILHTSNLYYNQPAIDAAEKIVKTSGMSKVFFTNSGTEAIEGALKVARKYAYLKDSSKDYEFIAMNHSFHGRSQGALSVTGNAHYQDGFVPVEMRAVFADFNDLEDVKSKITDKTCGIICEVVQGEGGIYPAKKEFLEGLRKLCDEKDILLIFDEVMTGFRVAPGGVQQLHGITPDLTCMGKVIGGGLPVGAFGGRAEIMDCLSPIGPVYQAGTLSGNPVAMAAGLAQLRELLDGNAYDRLEQLGARLEEGIREAIRKHGRNYTFHRAGSMFCLFFTEQEVYDLDSAQKASKELFKPFFWNMLEQGVYFAPSPYETGFISTAHTEEDIDRTVEAVHVSLSKLG